MPKLWTYIIIGLGLTLMMHFAGLHTGADSILTFMGIDDNGNVSNSAFYVALGALFISVVATGIAATFFGGTVPNYVALAPFAALNIIFLIGTYGSIITFTAGFDSWIKYPMFMLFAILSVGYLFALLEWVFGMDN